jgi:hypothetical protein
MTAPTFRNFAYRVGGLATIYLISILLTKEFFPGAEFVSVLVVTVLVFLILALKTLFNAGSKKKGAASTKAKRSRR